MSNKPKREKPLPGKCTTAHDEYCRNRQRHAINCLRKFGNSKHQGSKSLKKQYLALHLSCTDTEKDADKDK